MSLNRLFCLILAVGSAVLPVLAEPMVPVSGESPGLLDEFAVTRWQAEEGLPEDSIRALTFTSDGYLWCLTDTRPIRFDGLKFETLDWTGPGGGSGWDGVTETGGNTLWIHGAGGAYRFDSLHTGRSIWAGTAVSLQTPVDAVMGGPGQGLWAAVSNGVYKLAGRKSQSFTIPRRLTQPGVQVTSSEMGRDGVIWLTAGSSVLRFDRGQFTAETPASGEAVQYLSIGRDGTLWVATSGNVFCRRKDHWTSVATPPHRSHPRWRITALKAFDGGEVWVGTTSGLWRLQGETWSVLSPRDGIYPLEVRCIARDNEGNVWVGTSGGLLRLRRKAVQVYDSGLVLHRHSFTAVMSDPGVGLWVGVAGGGLLQGTPGSFKPFANPPVSRTAVISALLKSRDGSLWIGTQGDYLWRCRDNSAECVSEPSRGENSAVNVNALLEDRQGGVWVGTGDGLMTFNVASNRLERVPGIRETLRVHALIEDGGGAIWAGLQGDGVVRIPRKGPVAYYRQEQGLPSDTILALCCDEDGALWAGTTDGVAVWDGDRWRTITSKQGLPEGPVSQLVADGPALWLGTRYGIARLLRQEAREAAAGDRPVLSVQSFGRNEGMREEQCASGFGNLATRDASGRLWFSTQDGLVMIDPKRVPERSQLGLRVYFEEARVGDDLIQPLHNRFSHAPVSFTVPAGGRGVSLRYSAPFFTAPDQVQFKYQLEGYDTGWSAPTYARAAMYPRLPPGAYRFRVMAGVGGSWRESSQLVEFTVAPHLWQLWWVQLPAGSLVLAVVALWARSAEKRRTRRRFLALERQRALERERSRIAHDLHDDLGAALTEIGLMSAVAQRPAVAPERARHYLGEIAEKIRVMVDKLDEIVWAVNPRNDTVASLGNYFCECAQRILQLTPISCRLDLAPELPARPLDPDRRHNLFLAFNEALNNVIRHSGATEATVRIAVDHGRLTVEVADNGCGLDDGPVSEGSEGLISMRKRLERMGGQCEIIGRPGTGTRIRFIVPLG